MLDSSKDLDRVWKRIEVEVEFTVRRRHIRYFSVVHNSHDMVQGSERSYIIAGVYR